MLKLIISSILVISSIFLTSCDGNRFTIQIENKSVDSIQVNYVRLDFTDSLYIGGYPGITPSYTVRSIDQKYDSLTKTYTFFIPPKRTCTLVNVMNQDLDHLSDFVLCKRLEIIKGSDTIIIARNRGTSNIFNQSNEKHEATWTLVVD
ncbi:hypothetical protein [Fluviicola taffensis]|uniref:hypothetical protein n=1 Tax=Fluviicola taffensis TaxID=191579 RepID=UPI00313848D1